MAGESSQTRPESEEETKKEGGGKLSFFLAIFVLVLAFAGKYYMVMLTRGDSANQFDQAHGVPTVELTSDSSYLEIVERREPLLLTQTVADRWKARKTFTAKFLSTKLPQVTAYRQDNLRSFKTFHDNKPLEPLVIERWEDFNIRHSVTIRKLLTWDRPPMPNRGPYYYYSQDIQQIKYTFPEILTYVQPIDDLILSEENVQVNLWIGRAGLVTHTHYDSTYNIFVQIQGIKRFTLFPPNQTMYLYPCLHPHYGHSQVDILQPNMELYPHFTGLTAYVVDVAPGNVLVVPPYWFHHVETLRESVSINVWSDAPEYSIMNDIYSLPVPFEEDWTSEELTQATRVYIEMLLKAMDVPRPTTFIRSLVSQRYQPLVASGNVTVDNTVLQEMRDIFKTTNWPDKRLEYQSTLRSGLERLVTKFKTLPTREIVYICLGNYIEHLCHRTIGLNSIYPFLATFASV